MASREVNIGYCHTCDKQITLRSNTNLTCSDCNGNFIELFELNESFHENDNHSTAIESTLDQNLHNLSSYSYHEDEDNLELLFEENVPQQKEPKNKVPRLEKTQATNEEMQCLICFDQWTNSGDHCLVSLKCGHLFGQNCIVRWIQSNPKCAQCNQAAKVADVRRIFANSIKCVDKAEIEKLTKEKEEVKRQKENIEKKYKKLLEKIEKCKTNGNASVFSSLLLSLNEND